MRVNSNSTGDILAALALTQQQEQLALQQVSTGKRVNQPSDDPAAAALYSGNVAMESRIDQYLQSVGSLTTLSQTADSALGQVVTALNQAISLGTQAANGTLNSGDLQTIAQNLQGVLNQVVQLANTAFHGTYIFAGTASTTTPFTVSGTTVTYNGNSGVNTVAIADSRTIQSNLPGDQIFQQPGADVMGSLEQLIAAVQGGNTATINQATTAVNTALGHVSTERAFYGNNLNQLTGDKNTLNEQSLNLKTQDTTMVGVDLAVAATNLAQAQLVYQSTLSAAAKVLQASLLDYLK